MLVLLQTEGVCFKYLIYTTAHILYTHIPRLKGIAWKYFMKLKMTGWEVLNIIYAVTTQILETHKNKEQCKQTELISFHCCTACDLVKWT